MSVQVLGSRRHSYTQYTKAENYIHEKCEWDWHGIILIMIHLHSECNIELPALKTFEFDMTVINSKFSTKDSEKYA